MIRFLLLDLDDTILDFKKAEHIAVRQAIRGAGVEPTDAVCARYSQINQLHWQMMERGEITREQVLVDRFAMLFRELGKTADSVAVARSYEKLLGVGHYYLPGAEQTLKQELFGKYRLFLVSNGTASVQHSRLESAGLYPYFEQVFISEELGSHKPEPAFFDACFAKLLDFDRTQALMVGDSLTSDILGGIRSGLRTCWVNPQGKDAPPEIQPDYQIQGLSQLPALLEKL